MEKCDLDHTEILICWNSLRLSVVLFVKGISLEVVSAVVSLQPWLFSIHIVSDTVRSRRHAYGYPCPGKLSYQMNTASTLEQPSASAVMDWHWVCGNGGVGESPIAYVDDPKAPFLPCKLHHCTQGFPFKRDSVEREGKHNLNLAMRSLIPTAPASVSVSAPC